MSNILIFGDAEEGAINQAKNCLKDAEFFALMADNHKGYGMPVGGVAVYKDKITPAGVGFDIACGNKAVKTDLHINDIKSNLEEFADKIWNELSFGIGRKNNTPVTLIIYFLINKNVYRLFISPLWCKCSTRKQSYRYIKNYL